MQQFLAPKTMIVTGKPSPCECINEPDHVIICAFCVQANLMGLSEELDKITQEREVFAKRKFKPSRGK